MRQYEQARTLISSRAGSVYVHRATPEQIAELITGYLRQRDILWFSDTRPIRLRQLADWVQNHPNWLPAPLTAHDMAKLAGVGDRLLHHTIIHHGDTEVGSEIHATRSCRGLADDWITVRAHSLSALHEVFRSDPQLPQFPAPLSNELQVVVWRIARPRIIALAQDLYQNLNRLRLSSPFQRH